MQKCVKEEKYCNKCDIKYDRDKLDVYDKYCNNCGTLLISENKKKIMLTEYEKTQSSAEHHDRVSLEYSGIILAGMLILIGFVFENLRNSENKPFITVISILGISLSIFLMMSFWIAGGVKNQKYDRCKDIEKLLGMKQHSNLRYKKYIMRTAYTIVIVLLITTWIIFLKNV